jgi:hypothetical protein
MEIAVAVATLVCGFGGLLEILKFFGVVPPSIGQERKVTSKKRTLFWAVTLNLFCLVGASYALYRSFMPPDLFEFDDPSHTLVVSYGLQKDLSCEVTVDTTTIWRYHDKYKVAAACFVYDGLGPILDAKPFWVGAAYDIQRDAKLKMIAKPSGPAPLPGTNYVVLLVPDGIDISQFHTLREARNLKVRIISLSSQSPS